MSESELDNATEYLGDGVYASFDGYHIWLKTQRAHGLEAIALEPAVLEEFLRYVRRFDPAYGKGEQ